MQNVVIVSVVLANDLVVVVLVVVVVAVACIFLWLQKHCFVDCFASGN